MAYVDKTVNELKARIADLDRTVLSLRSQLDEALKRIQSMLDGDNGRDAELIAMKQKYEESLELTLHLQLQISKLETEKNNLLNIIDELNAKLDLE